MQRFIFKALLVLALLPTVVGGWRAEAQITHIYPALDTNNSFTGINYVEQLVPGYGTYAQMQAWVSPPPQMVWFMTDATAVGNCTTHGGLLQAWCGYWDGNWVSLGGGTGGGGGDTITSPNNTIVVGGSPTATTVDVVGGTGEILAGSTPALTYQPVLGIPNSHAGKLGLASGSANATTGLLSGATSNWTLTFPATAGTANYVLQTDGSGNTSWVANGGGSILCSQLPALTGDTTTLAGSCATDTVKINHGAPPTSANVGGWNSSGQPVVGTTSYSQGITDIAPVSGDQIMIVDSPLAVTLTSVVCGTQSATSVIVDLKPASESGWGTLGSSILSGTITATPSGASGTITTSALSANTPLMVVVGTVSGAVANLYCRITYTRGF